MHVQVSVCDAFLITRVSRPIPVQLRPSSLIFTSHPAARVASTLLSDGAESGRFVPSLRRPRRPPFSSFNHSTGLLSACHPLFPSNSGRFTTNNEDVHCSTFCGYCESPRKLHYSSGDALFRPREKSRALPGGVGRRL